MKRFYFLGLTFLAILFSGCATVYTTSEIQNQKNQHQVIAILPFDVMIQYNKLPRNFTVEQIEENEYELGFVFQNQIYNRFLRKGHEFTVDFQDIDKTNI